MRKFKTLLLAMAMVCAVMDTRAPLIPPAPSVVDTRESIRAFVGYWSPRMSIQSNMIAGILEQETRTAHRTNRDPKRGVYLGPDGDTGAGQVVRGHERRMRKIWGPQFSLTNLNDNLRAAMSIYSWDYRYYRGKGWNQREATLRAIQSFNCGIVGRAWKSRIHRRRKYMWHVLHFAENAVIPRQYH